MCSPEVRLLQDLHKHAFEIRTLAYALPTGWGAHEILQLANRLVAVTANEGYDEIVVEKLR